MVVRFGRPCLIATFKARMVMVRVTQPAGRGSAEVFREWVSVAALVEAEGLEAVEADLAAGNIRTT